MKEDQYTEIWRQYQEGLDYLHTVSLFTRAEESFRYTFGDQWHGLKAGTDRPAQLNVLLPIMKSSTSLVGQNNMSIVYGSLNYDSSRGLLLKVCEKLNRHAERQWEKLKLDKAMWDFLQDAFVSGDSFAYFYDDGGQIAMEEIDTTNILLADEQNPNLQEQPYILIVQRRYVEDVRNEAKANGIKDVEQIIPDDDTDLQINGQIEVKNKSKLTCVMKMWKEDGNVCIARSTRNVVYQDKTVIEGMTLYPIAKYTWKPIKGAARGYGDIWDKIPNQIAINKAYYRFDAAIKNAAYPHKIYNEDALSAADIKSLSYPDSNIAVRDNNHLGVDKIIRYMQPGNISPYAKDVWQDLITLTRELSGAGDNLENINPEQASGAAIQAARDAKALNVNAQVAAYKQFIEDIALIWYDMWTTYNPNGLEVVSEDENGMEYVEIIPPELLKALKVDIRIDVSPNTTYSKIAQDLALKELFVAGAITFDEFVEALDDNSTMPKGKLEDILAARKAMESKATAQKIMELTGIIEQQQGEIQALRGQARTGQTAQDKLISLTNALREENPM